MTDQLDIFDRPAAQAHSETSRAAAESIAPVLGTLQRRVLAVLRAHPSGMTDEELIDACPEMSPNSPRARRVELWSKLGLVEDSGHTRQTKSGRAATVWRAL